MHTRIAALAASAAVVGTAGFAQVVDRWDVDADGVLDETEFREGFLATGAVDGWDADDDGFLGPDEFADGLYELWDTSGDGELSVNEWDDGVDAWFGEELVDLRVEEWDEDSDGVISRFEFAETFVATHPFDRFDAVDADGLLGEDDFTAGIFDAADLDDDDAIGPAEDDWLTEIAEFMTPGDAEGGAAAEASVLNDARPIERGEAFAALPLPCEAGTCADLAAEFCGTLGYGDPIDFLDAGGALHAVRCADEL